MITVEELNKEALCSVIDQNGSFSEAIPVFKHKFAKKTKEVWKMFENGDKFTNKELMADLNEMILLINTLKHNISEYSQHSGDLEDWV